MLAFAIIRINDETGEFDQVMLEPLALKGFLADELTSVVGRVHRKKKLRSVIQQETEVALDSIEQRLRDRTSGIV